MRDVETFLLSEMVGKTFISVSGEVGGEELVFVSEDGTEYKFYHSQDCCESVTIEDIAGDLESLVGNPLLIAEKSVSGDNPEGVKPEFQDSFTWNFYKFATVRGYVTVRWYGESNGFYSESVDICKTNRPLF